MAEEREATRRTIMAKLIPRNLAMTIVKAGLKMRIVSLFNLSGEGITFLGIVLPRLPVSIGESPARLPRDL
jgi:hypothetical protein